MIKITEIAWLAGILEGEGYFTLIRGRYPTIRLGMTDEDVIVKAARLMKRDVTRYKTSYIISIGGALAIQWMMTLYPYLGKRRGEQVISIIKFWRESSYKAAPGMKSMAKCHPDRIVQGYGLCKSCYGKEYHRKRKLMLV